MKKYIGVKIVEAEPMTQGEAADKGFYPRKITDRSAEGYHVHYTNNDYDSWSPKAVFEDSYREYNPLLDTALGMCHSDYKERFKAEYKQLKIRYTRLTEMCKSWDEGTLKFEPTCPRKLYDEQLEAMGHYLAVLEKRAELENVELDK